MEVILFIILGVLGLEILSKNRKFDFLKKKKDIESYHKKMSDKDVREKFRDNFGSKK